MSAPAPHAGLEEGARSVVSILQSAGHQAYWAGGCVRDRLLGIPAKDFDIATSARPEQVQALFASTHAVGRAFGVVLVEHDGCTYEVATFRKDDRYTDGRHPESVQFTHAEEDARRRDFTINGMFFDPIADRILDYVAGQQDLAAGVVRAIGHPGDRFAEDHLRMLRAIRFTSTLGFALDPKTADAIHAQADDLRKISAERIQIELIRILTESKKPGQAIELMQRTGLLAVLLPEIVALQGVDQPPEYHPEGDVYRHTVIMLDHLDHPTPELALSVLLHDIGKPATQRRVRQPDGRERIRFDGHADVGARMAEEMLLRLRCSRALTEHVTTCVRQHMRFLEVRKMRTATLRRMVMAPTFETELALHRVDCLGSNGNLDNYAFVRAFAESLKNEPLKPTPHLRGEDILASGVPAGPEVRRLLETAYDLQLEGRITSPEEARRWLKRHLAEDTKGPRPGPAAD